MTAEIIRDPEEELGRAARGRVYKALLYVATAAVFPVLAAGVAAQREFVEPWIYLYLALGVSTTCLVTGDIVRRATGGGGPDLARVLVQILASMGVVLSVTFSLDPESGGPIWVAVVAMAVLQVLLAGWAIDRAVNAWLAFGRQKATPAPLGRADVLPADAPSGWGDVSAAEVSAQPFRAATKRLAEYPAHEVMVLAVGLILLLILGAVTVPGWIEDPSEAGDLRILLPLLGLYLGACVFSVSRAIPTYRDQKAGSVVAMDVLLTAAQPARLFGEADVGVNDKKPLRRWRVTLRDAYGLSRSYDFYSRHRLLVGLPIPCYVRVWRTHHRHSVLLLHDPSSGAVHGVLDEVPAELQP